MKQSWSQVRRPQPAALLGLALAVVSTVVAVAQSSNAVAPLSYDSFRTISDHNIFNPNRYVRGTSRPVTRPSTQPAARVEAISLVGVMAYEQGVFAFFDGTKSDYKQALQADGMIGEYKVSHIAPDAVTLRAGTNTFELKVGMQMRREDEGDWFVSEGADTPRKRIVSTRTRTRGSSRGGDSAGGFGGEDVLMGGGEPEVIVLEGDPTSEPQLNNGNGGAEPVQMEAPADDGGVADPVLLRLMQRRQQMNQ